VRLPLPALSLLLAASLHAGGLRDEALAFLERLSAQGYPGTGMRLEELTLLEPCTLSIYPPAGSPAGFVIGMGGDDVLDLHLRLECGDWSAEDTLPDDLPVLEVDPGGMGMSGSLYAIVCARDMIRGSMADSVAVIWAFAPPDTTAGAPE